MHNFNLALFRALFVFLLIILIPINMLLVRASSYSGSVWKDCINLVTEGGTNFNSNDNSFISEYDRSGIGKQIKNIKKTGYAFLFYESPWPIQEQKTCQIIDQVIPSGCEPFDSRPEIYPRLIKNPGTQKCVYTCSNGDDKHFTQADEDKYKSKAYEIKYNQKHLASYGQGLMFIYARLIKDMLGRKLPSGQLFFEQCESVSSCKIFCKKTLFNYNKNKLAMPYYSDGGDGGTKYGSPTGPAFGYVKNQEWVNNSLTVGANPSRPRSGSGPCELYASRQEDDTSYGINYWDIVAPGLPASFPPLLISGRKCILTPPPAGTEALQVFGPVPESGSDYRYFNAYAPEFTDSIIQPADDTGGRMTAISMVDCLCESLFTGAED